MHFIFLHFTIIKLNYFQVINLRCQSPNRATLTDVMQEIEGNFVSSDVNKIWITEPHSSSDAEYHSEDYKGKLSKITRDSYITEYVGGFGNNSEPECIS